MNTDRTNVKSIGHRGHREGKDSDMGFQPSVFSVISVADMNFIGMHRLLKDV
jgi:hypothetical protein